MNWLDNLLERRRLMLATAVMLAISGILSWMTMDRQEDPFFPYRWGFIVTDYPGADVYKIERLVLKPLEEQLAQVEEVRNVISTVRANFMLVTVELQQSIYDTDAAWDRVRSAVKKAQLEWPDGVGEPDIQDKQMDATSVVYSISGGTDLIALRAAAEKLKKRFFSLNNVSRVRVFGDPGEQVTIALDDAAATRLGLSPEALAVQLQGRNQIASGGGVRLAGRTATLRPNTEFTSIAEIEATPIQLPGGGTVPLSEIATVRHGPAEPPGTLAWRDGEPAMGVGIYLPPNTINMVKFGEEVRTYVDELREDFAPYEIEEMFFAPDQVEKRLDDLGNSLAVGVAIVAAILFIAMGLRLGLVVVLVLLLVTFGSIGIYALGGGVLHQMSIAGLVIALGMLVDNAIVMVEDIQWRRDRGEGPWLAAVASVKALAAPLGAATGTTLAAFVPMLLSKGNTADFTQAIPITIMLTLIVSYLYCIFVTPALARGILKPAKRQPDGSFLEKVGAACGRVAINVPWWIAVGLLLSLSGVLYLAKHVDKEFFPRTDRTEVILDLYWPEGTHIETARDAAKPIENQLRQHPASQEVLMFAGSTGPRFYYNLYERLGSPHLVRMITNATSGETADELVKWARAEIPKQLPEVELVAGRMVNGPPVNAPVEILVYANTREDLAEAIDSIYRVVKSTPGTVDIRHDLGVGIPSISYNVNDAVASRHQLSRNDVANALLGRSSGLPIGSYRAGDEPVPIKIRSDLGDRFAVSELGSVNVYNRTGQAVPIMQLTTTSAEWHPGAIQHRKHKQFGTVRSELLPGYTSGRVVAALKEEFKTLELPRGAFQEFGGEAEGSGDANDALAQAVPLGLVLLMFFLLLQFNSFRRLAIVMTTVPLALIGVIPGMLLSSQPFGFMSTLGVVALVGIVVNNAIVLIDLIDNNLVDGRRLDDAIIDAVTRRIRPILLTTVTTVAGLLPLAYSSAPNWPPLAWAIISGLIASTVLTMIAVPALYKLMLGKQKKVHGHDVRGVTTAVVVLLAGGLLVTPESSQAEPGQMTDRQAIDARIQLLKHMHDYRVLMGVPAPSSAELAKTLRDNYPQTGTPLEGEVININLSMALARQRPLIQAARLQAHAADQNVIVAERRGSLPTVEVTGWYSVVDDVPEATLPSGPTVQFGSNQSWGAQLKVTQPVLDLATQRYGVAAARASAQASDFAATRQADDASLRAAEAYINALKLIARRESVETLILALEARQKDAQVLKKAGNALQADLLKIELALAQARHQHKALNEQERFAKLFLSNATGVPFRVNPLPVSDRQWRALILPDLKQGQYTMLTQRADLQQLRAQRQALRQQVAAVGAEALPTVQVNAEYNRNEGQPFAADQEWRATVGVRWTPFAAGTRGPRQLGLAEQMVAVERQLLDSEARIFLELENARSNFNISRSQADLTILALDSATENLRVERQRFKAGKARANDVLEAESDLSEAVATQRLAGLDVTMNWLRFQHLTGELMRLPD